MVKLAIAFAAEATDSGSTPCQVIFAASLLDVQRQKESMKPPQWETGGSITASHSDNFAYMNCIILMQLQELNVLFVEKTSEYNILGIWLITDLPRLWFNILQSSGFLANQRN